MKRIPNESRLWFDPFSSVILTFVQRSIYFITLATSIRMSGRPGAKGWTCFSSILVSVPSGRVSEEVVLIMVFKIMGHLFHSSLCQLLNVLNGSPTRFNH